VNVTGRRASARPGRPSGVDTRAQEPSDCSDLSPPVSSTKEGEGKLGQPMDNGLTAFAPGPSKGLSREKEDCWMDWKHKQR
jgi:hypothetical protein